MIKRTTIYKSDDSELFLESDGNLITLELDEVGVNNNSEIFIYNDELEKINKLVFGYDIQLLRELCETAHKLDVAYCTLASTGESSFTGEEYEKLADVIVKAEEILNIK